MSWVESSPPPSGTARLATTTGRGMQCDESQALDRVQRLLPRAATEHEKRGKSDFRHKLDFEDLVCRK